MKPIFLSSLLLLSFSALAYQTSNEPMVNFEGASIGITKTCLSTDGLRLKTKEPVALYGMVERAGKKISTYMGEKFLETSVNYRVPGKCERVGVKGNCVSYEPSSEAHYELNGSFEIQNYKTVAGKVKVKISSTVIDYQIEYCL